MGGRQIPFGDEPPFDYLGDDEDMVADYGIPWPDEPDEEHFPPDPDAPDA